MDVYLRIKSVAINILKKCGNFCMFFFPDEGCYRNKMKKVCSTGSGLCPFARRVVPLCDLFLNNLRSNIIMTVLTAFIT